jgi:hypothetical protein
MGKIPEAKGYYAGAVKQAALSEIALGSLRIEGGWN